jgi:hypothetical protein
MTRRILYLVLLALLLTDTAYSFIQHMNQPLDGDMAAGIVPAPDVQPILDDPLGISVITEGKTYPNPNRFFSHWSFMRYFSHVPLFLQSLADPVESVYLSCAIAKTIIQLSIIFLLAFYITGTANLRKLEFLLAAVLITPLFQANGYRSYMGIIDPATTYTFFYALPAVLLLIYFAPFFIERFHGVKNAGWLMKLVWIPLAFVVCLSGPLNPGVVLVLAAIAFPVLIAERYNSLKSNGTASIIKAIHHIPGRYWFCFVPVAVLSIYSLSIGRFNSVNIEHAVPLAQLYPKLPKGLFSLLTGKPGFLLLLGMLAVNTVIIRAKLWNEEGRKLISCFKWIGLFALIYILLLPLGGARDYRPLVARYDTFLPVTIGLMFIFGATVLFIGRQAAGKMRIAYASVVMAVLLAFTVADKPELEKNDCEKHALKNIYASGADTLPAVNDCPVLSWERSVDPGQASINELLLKRWRIMPAGANEGE